MRRSRPIHCLEPNGVSNTQQIWLDPAGRIAGGHGPRLSGRFTAAGARTARLLAVVWLTFTLGPTGRAGELTVGQARPGNLFGRDESAAINVQATGANRLEWTTRDYRGTKIQGGSVVLDADGRTVLRPATDQPGYFDLHLVARRGAALVAEANAAFAVLAPPPQADPGSPFGVMTHLAQGWNPELMPLLARVGIRHLRDEQYWKFVEPARGTYVFSREYLAYMAAAAASGVEPLLEMTFDNAVYDHDPAAPALAWTPHTDDGRRGYARYGRALLERYGGQVRAVEVWNEYNGTWCVGPAAADRPRSYAALLAAAHAELKATRSDVRVVGGAAVLVPLPWFEDLFAAGAYPNLDVVAVHPYRSAPEGVETDLAALRDLMRRTSGDGTSKPVWATECGTVDETTPGRRAAARYLVRLYTLMLSEGVERAYWYAFKDHDDYRGGLVRGEQDPRGRYAPTATLAAYANLIRQFHGAAPEPLRREATDRRTRVYAFRVPGADAGGEQLRVAWSLAPPSRLVLAADAPLTLVDLMGRERVLRPDAGGTVNLTVDDDDPVFVRGTVTAVREVGRDVLLADSVEDFGPTQGAAPGTWGYGVFDGGGRDGRGAGAYGPEDFKPMAWTRTEWGYQWQSPYLYAKLDAHVAHPSGGPHGAVWAVRRWRSPVSGPVRLTGAASRGGAGGDGTGIKILVDGREVFAALLGNGQAAATSFDLSFPVRAGSTVDLAVTPGPGADINFDAVEFHAQVSQPAPDGEPGRQPRRR